MQTNILQEDHDRMQVLYEDNLKETKILRSEYSNLRSQHDLLKQSYYKIEGDSKQQIHQLMQDLAVANE